MRKYFFILLCLFISERSFAQRLLKGQVGFEAVAGAVSDKKPVHDYFIQTGLTVNAKNGNYKFLSFEYARKTHFFEAYNIPVESFISEGGYCFPVLRDWGKNISFNMAFSAVVGYEIFNKSEPLLPNGAVIQNEDSFLYGGAFRVTVETYVSDHLLFIILGKTKALWGTSVENFRPSAGIGLRYIF